MTETRKVNPTAPGTSGTSVPGIIRMAGRNFRVEVLPSDMMPDLLGQITSADGRVKLSHDQSPCSMKETLLHEILHEASIVTASDLSENQVIAISKTLFGFFRDNPDVVAWMLEEED